MKPQHYEITKTQGFLCTQAAEKALTESLASLPSPIGEALGAVLVGLPAWAEAGSTCEHLRRLPLYDVNQQTAETTREVLFMLYGYCACAWVCASDAPIPQAIGQALINLGAALARPPMLAYAGMVLNNWRLVDETRGFVPDNLEVLVRFTHLLDESWFFRVHMAIEAQAGAMLKALVDSQVAIAADDMQAVLVHLRTMQQGLVRITQTFHEMPDHCDPDVYYQQIRPYLMSFADTVQFEGVTPQPTPLRGGSGAQSSIVPAMLASLGIAHRASQLTHNLDDMRRYMPHAHQAFIRQMAGHPLRAYCQAHPPLRDAYNHVLRQLVTFRRAHLHYAKTFIFAKSTNPIGTGGTPYMSFLSKLIDETLDQLL